MFESLKKKKKFISHNKLSVLVYVFALLIVLFLLGYGPKIYLIISSSFAKQQHIDLNAGSINQESFDKLSSHYTKIVFDSDPHVAIQQLREDTLNDENILGFCHDILHEIGHAAFTKYGSFQNAVVYQDEFCNSGYIHGVFESYFKSTKNPLSNLQEQCNYPENKSNFDLWQCYHGMGHGFMYLTDGSLDESLSFCAKGLKGEAVEDCQNGVYMELFNLELLPKERTFLKEKNPFSVCLNQDTDKKDCYIYVPAFLSDVLNENFVDILKECSKSESAYKSDCIGGVGAEAMKRNMNDTSKVFSLCRNADSYSDQMSCVYGAVNMYMSQEASYYVGQKLCETAPWYYKDICEQTIQDKKSFFITDK